MVISGVMATSATTPKASVARFPPTAVHRPMVIGSRKAAVSDGIRILRERLSDNLQRVSSGADYGLFCAVLLGDKTGLSEESNDLFRFNKVFT